jgi:hypothetical protein
MMGEVVIRLLVIATMHPVLATVHPLVEDFREATAIRRLVGCFRLHYTRQANYFGQYS